MAARLGLAAPETLEYTPSTPALTRSNHMTFAKLESLVLDKLTETRLPGLSAAIVKGDEVIWSRGFGFRNLETGQAATPNTIYSIGSVTKSFTCLAIMQLAEAGKLKIDDAVDKYFPFDIRPGGKKVKIWHFMSHTSGIPALAYAESVISGVIGSVDHWFPIATYNDLLTFMQDAGDWTLNKPGERWFYLNEGYALLGRIVEVASGMPYVDYVTKHILQPLGMDRSVFTKDEVEGDHDSAIPYVNWAEGKRIPSTYAYGTITADGGLVSSVLDLAKYISMYLRRGKTDNGKLLSKDSITEMETPRVATPVKESPFGEEGYGYGLGSKSDFLGHTLIGHGGSVGVATAYLGYIPDKNVGVAILTNGSGFATGQFGMYGLALALGENPDELPFMRRARLLTELEGNYEAYKGTVKLQVKRAGDLLMVEETDKYNTVTTVLIPSNLEEKSRQFYRLENGAKIEAEFQVQDGQVQLIIERYMLRRTGKLTPR
jgi:CubicO group peptidase (beta-lactamase class C family)